ELMIEKRTGELCPKAIIQNALNELLDTRQSITDFAQQLMAQNIRPIPNIASAGKMNGFSFVYRGIAFKASQLGKGYSWSALQNKLNYQPERDNAFLFELKASVSEAPCTFIATDAPEITTREVHSPIEALIHDNRAGQDEHTNASVKQFHLEDGAGAKESLKEAPDRSYAVSAFRWLEYIPYLDLIYRMLKNLKIPTLKRPRKHKTITGVRVVEIMPIPQKTLIESPPQSRRASLSM
ncbi:relaxase, partial [Salmonella enterica]|nr:relaxase [Salmonella enterica]EHC2619186.1 relaxase [Salmonella enterica]EKN7090335.1 relaxase [Salmonella enterica]EKQ8823410.1 relaxase [Salmonella enterica]EKS3651432.1 relaxase [Salmonella enterica]